MIEVFRTSVNDFSYAAIVIGRIQSLFPEYRVNFDLADCDRILRVCSAHTVNVHAVIEIVNELGFTASVLEDEPRHTLPARS